VTEEQHLSLSNPGPLLSELSHELRTLMGIVGGTNDMLLNGAYGELSPKQLRAANRIKRTHTRMVTLVSDFMTYVKATSGTLVLNPVPFNPDVLIKDQCDQVRKGIENQGLQFVLEQQSSSSNFVGDSEQVRQIFTILLSNALHATQIGAICVRTQWIGISHWSLAIQDSGSGIPLDKQPFIFDPFWKSGHDIDSRSEGFGMGLAIADRLVKHLGGTLNWESAVNRGSTFTVILPLQNTRELD
jgi:signal transduction histidine kinase